MQLTKFLLFFVTGCLNLFLSSEEQTLTTDKSSTGDAEKDRVIFLPGIDPQPTFAGYSGFLAGSTPNIQLHYWLIQAEKQPEKAPLLLWLNGGPGCSSMQGALLENGPFFIQPGQNLEINPHSWNKLGNVLYLETPAGVGYSYAVDGNVTADDDLTSKNSYYAIQNFLERFPEYKGRDFFITGESYGGVYVPTLAVRLIEKPLALKLKGIAVGNGLMNYRLNDNSLVYFANYHGLMDEDMWSDALKKCCGAQPTRKCFFTDTHSTYCEKLVNDIYIRVWGLNVYNIYAPCAGGVNGSFQQTQLRPKEIVSGRLGSNLVYTDFGNLFRTNSLLKAERSVLRSLVRSANTRLIPPCMDDTSIRSYLNSRAVRKALHVDLPKVGVWEACSSEVNSNYRRNYKDLSPQYIQILKSKVPVLLFSGDVDSVCNYFGTLWFVDGLSLKTEKPLKHWLYTDRDGTSQVGGVHKVMRLDETDLWYVTIRGSGHMAPTDKPIPTFHMIRSFIQSKPLN
ncbi:unnamed protein product [Calicophoron daubneyi]|uniref:Carboxypeptidase n=1 Tax=Calicophoron daubneyi TaxID=300641 RepID=A0AAV2TDM8_CALDB